MTADYSGLTRNNWPGTWSPSSDAPIVLDTEIRGSLQSISGASGDRLTDITGQRLTEGMVVYLKNGYSAGQVTRTGDRYFTYRLLAGQSRNSSTGVMPNAEENWTEFAVGSGGQGGVGYTGSQGAIGYTGSTGLIDGMTSNGVDTVTLNQGYNLVPATDRQQNLGSADKRFGSLYLSGNTLFIDNAKVTVNAQGEIAFYDLDNNVIAVHTKEVVIGTIDGQPTILRQNNTGGLEMVMNGGTPSQQVFNVAIGYTGSQGQPGISGENSINTATDVDSTNLNDGSVLVYAAGNSKWRATLNINQQFIDGGEF